jgi:hypothetical protein
VSILAADEYGMVVVVFVIMVLIATGFGASLSNRTFGREIDKTARPA